MLLQDFRLKVFVAVAEEKSFTKAALRLDVSQPAISQNIAELEKSLDMRLFERLKGEVLLTPAGEVFLTHARRLLETGASFQRLFAGIPSGTVRVAASDDVYAYFIEPRLADFSIVHPDVVFERTLPEDADAVFAVRPSSGIPFDTDSEVIMKIRVSASLPPKEMGDISAAHENTSYFDLIFRPTPPFSQTGICRVIKDYFASLL